MYLIKQEHVKHQFYPITLFYSYWSKNYQKC